MHNKLEMLESLVNVISSAPTFAEMPKRTLADKGIDGPTGAHVIEQLHTPLNFAFVTFTTGTSAFQNIVGVTWPELETRIRAGCQALALAQIDRGTDLLVTYAPLINVFTQQALVRAGVQQHFLQRSNRDSLLLALCKGSYHTVLGESSFLRATLEQAYTLGLEDLLPKKLCLLTAGAPLDFELLTIANRLGYDVHDLYGCQEFGWLLLDGVPLRDDIVFIPSPVRAGYHEIVVGGIPIGDMFPLSSQGHICSGKGDVLTYKRQRSMPEYEAVVTQTTCHSREVIERTARTLLRIKGRIVRVAPDLILNAAATEIKLFPAFSDYNHGSNLVIRGPEKTAQFDLMIAAQIELQSSDKKDSTWLKGS
ncbi:hypothetical protein [Yersinia pseudotuberculosis]|uniref:hypothetical protein n=1 Tax=Yersinia pseudotuberculosis TaxID=633 RepID=UPI0005E1F575|nr:hypothetical protein [Yersinia pseudotuberculosis]CNC80584.1 Uncharacterised protein [Yersinia pseudotuberculosis]